MNVSEIFQEKISLILAETKDFFLCVLSHNMLNQLEFTTGYIHFSPEKENIQCSFYFLKLSRDSIHSKI